MNTSKIIKACTVCMMIVGATSCNDSFMDRFPIAEISPENSFKTAKDLELYTNSFYENLPKINVFFDNYGRCEDKVAASQYEGVARFFRAWFYFEKVKNFGGVPWYETA